MSATSDELGTPSRVEQWVSERYRGLPSAPAQVSELRGVPGDVTAYHFDGSYLNLIFPVIIPKISGPRRGQLVIYPNVRSFKRTPWTTKVVPALARVPQLRRLWKKREIDYQEDTVYAFYG